VFQGNHRKQTGGIRVIGEDHVVEGNYLSGLEGDEARSAICLQNAIENSPLHGYFQVKRAIIRNNTVLDCNRSITIGYGDEDVKATLPPIDTEFSGNYVVAEGKPLVALVDAAAKIAWKDNVMWGSETGIGTVPGISLNEIKMKRAVPKTPSRAEAGVTWLRPTP
jgi:poly(beta-D-mannuronate) lyase